MRAQPADVGLLPSHQIGIKTNNPFSSVMWVTVDCQFFLPLMVLLQLEVVSGHLHRRKCELVMTVSTAVTRVCGWLFTLKEANSKRWFTTSCLLPLPYLVTP